MLNMYNTKNTMLIKANYIVKSLILPFSLTYFYNMVYAISEAFLQ